MSICFAFTHSKMFLWMLLIEGLKKDIKREKNALKGFYKETTGTI